MEVQIKSSMQVAPLLTVIISFSMQYAFFSAEDASCLGIHLLLVAIYCFSTSHFRIEYEPLSMAG